MNPKQVLTPMEAARRLAETVRNSKNRIVSIPSGCLPIDVADLIDAHLSYPKPGQPVPVEPPLPVTTQAGPVTELIRLSVPAARQALERLRYATEFKAGALKIQCPECREDKKHATRCGVRDSFKTLTDFLAAFDKNEKEELL
jgi:hypothetical protein